MRLYSYTVVKVSLLTFSTNGDELDALAGDEVERLVHVGDLVEPHLASAQLNCFRNTLDLYYSFDEKAKPNPA
jgi:hypothetical protein